MEPKAQLFIPSCMRTRIIWAVGEAERLKGGPVYLVEVVVVFQRNVSKMFNSFLICMMIGNMFREDLFFCDKEFVKISCQRHEGLELHSEKFARLYEGYMFDKHLHVVAKPETPVLNLKQLIKLLRSSDTNLWERSKWAFDGTFR